MGMVYEYDEPYIVDRLRGKGIDPDEENRADNWLVKWEGFDPLYPQR